MSKIDQMTEKLAEHVMDRLREILKEDGITISERGIDRLWSEIRYGLRISIE